MTTRDLIKQKMSEHTAKGNFICAQSLLGAGGVANTVSLEDKKGLIDLPISDSSNPGVCVGMALGGKKPVYIIRYSGFSTINFWPIVNYAAKCKELWEISCKLFVRVISSEGSIGPVASNMAHSIYAHYPGLKVYAPMLPSEWQTAWDDFNSGDGPVICSEYRASYDLKEDDLWNPGWMSGGLDVNIFAIGGARIQAQEASNLLWQQRPQIVSNVIHINKLCPLEIPKWERAKLNIVVDSDYARCGIAEHIGYQLAKDEWIGEQGFVHVVGLKERSAGFAKHCDNITPQANEIVGLINQLK